MQVFIELLSTAVCSLLLDENNDVDVYIKAFLSSCLLQWIYCSRLSRTHKTNDYIITSVKHHLDKDLEIYDCVNSRS